MTTTRLPAWLELDTGSHSGRCGVSGTGVVAEGVQFSDGTVALRWTSAWPTSVVFHDRGMESVRAVHGHDGRTRIVWV